MRWVTLALLSRVETGTQGEGFSKHGKVLLEALCTEAASSRDVDAMSCRLCEVVALG
jgi:hypothetical protein